MRIAVYHNNHAVRLSSLPLPGPFNCHPERSEGSKVLAFLGVLLSKHF